MSSRLTPEHLAEWRKRYLLARNDFVMGVSGRIVAGDALRNLNFRDDALRIELLEWEKWKAEHRKRMGLR